MSKVVTDENGLTASEFSVIDKLAEAYNEFQDLPVGHPDDLDEFTRAIHAAQNIVMSRLAVRMYPDRFTQPD